MATPSGFHALCLDRIIEETVDAKTLILAIPPHLRERFAGVSGQHVTLRFEIEGQEERRSYSLTPIAGAGELSVTVKLVQGGLVSSHIHTNLAPGALIDVGPPSGRFVLPPAETETPRTFLAIAAGSGITPISGMIGEALARHPGNRFVLVYGNRSADRIIFRERLEAMKDRHLGRFALVHVLSRDADGDVPVLAGRIDAARVARLVPSLVPPSTIDVAYLCGPGTMIKEARDALLGLGLAKERIKFEFFKQGPESSEPRRQAAPPIATAPPAGSEAVVIVDGVRKSFRVPAGGHVVDAALSAGIAVPYACKGGMCCTCRAKLVEGRVTMTRNFSLQDWEMAAGFVLACQAVPETERVVLDFDRV
jgi:ring-1,2-phenylacetyl-CoA epoxidase subunit PaaE